MENENPENNPDSKPEPKIDYRKLTFYELMDRAKAGDETAHYEARYRLYKHEHAHYLDD